MLSAAGRAALQRLGARASSRTLVISKLTAPASQWQTLQSLQTIRLYAATTRSAKAAPAKALATKKPAAKTTMKTKAKPKAKVVKKAPAAKKTKAKKPVAKKLRAKKSIVKKAKKPVTEAALKRKEAKTRQELKKTALFTEPKPLPEFAFRAYVTEKLVGKSGDFKDQSAKLAAVAESFKSISEAEKQRYTSIGEENQRTNAVAYKAWVESHTLDQINAAINARLRLKRDFNYPKGNPKPIKDERLPKRPISAFAYYTKAKWAAGDVTEGGSRSMGASAAAISADWKNLSASQRQPYEDLQRAESLRYEKEYEAAFGRKPEAKKQSPEP